MEQPNYKKIKSFLIFELGEVFFDIITLNPDGVSGDFYIRNKVKISDIKEMLSLYRSKFPLIISELDQFPNLVAALDKTVYQLNDIIRSVSQTNTSLRGHDVFELNFKSFLGSYLIFINKKKNLHITMEQMFIAENESILLEIKTKIRNKYWTPAFEQNYQRSINDTYAVFKSNIRENPYIETMKFVSF